VFLKAVSLFIFSFKMRYKKFIIKLLVFSLPLAFFLIFTELKLRKLDNSYTFKKRNFEKVVDSIELLILGDSHSYYGVDPKYISLRSFNLANASQSFFYDKEITLKYLPRLNKLKLIMIPVNYFSFYFRMMDMSENWRDFAYEKFWGIRYPGISWWDSRNYSYLMMYSPEKTFSFLKKGFKVELTDGIAPNGHFMKDTTGNLKVLNNAVGKMIQKTHQGMINFALEKENVGHLSELLDSLQKKNIKVILFTTPVASTYSKFCDPAILSRNKTIIDKMVAKYKLPYKNYFSDSRFSVGDFGDNDHLNFVGAKKFTMILDEELVKPYMAVKDSAFVN
jgi:hypothetical protein